MGCLRSNQHLSCASKCLPLPHYNISLVPKTCSKYKVKKQRKFEQRHSEIKNHDENREGHKGIYQRPFMDSRGKLGKRSGIDPSSLISRAILVDI